MITGGVIAIIIGSLAAIGGVIMLFVALALAGLPGAAGRVPAILYIIVYAVLLFYVLVALVNLMAGIKALVIVAKPEVKERFRYGR